MEYWMSARKALVVIVMMMVITWDVCDANGNGDDAGNGDGMTMSVMNVHQISDIVVNLVEQQLSDCHLTLLTDNPSSQLVSNIARRVSGGLVVVSESKDGHSQLHGIWRDTKITCRVVIILYTSYNNISTNTTTLSLLEELGLWRRSDTRVVVVGELGKTKIKEILLHHSVRNTLHVIYLAIHHTASNIKLQKHQLIPAWLVHKGEDEDMNKRVSIYRRCMYCKDGGMSDVQYISEWNYIYDKQFTLPNAHTLLHGKEELENLNGHEVRYVIGRFLPYIDYKRNNDVDYTATFKDCIDYRIASALAHHLNFRYSVRAEPKRIWGVEKNGKFNGMMGELEKETSDMCTAAGPNPTRLRVAEFNIGYPSDQLTVVSLKPKLLPQHLVLVRPFASEVWIGVLLGMLVMAISLWILQGVWAYSTTGDSSSVHFSTTLLYSWGSVLEQPPSDPSVNISGQVLVGWYLVYCVVIITGYESSLIAALTVQSKSKPVETLEDLVNANGWQWGMEPWLFTGLPYGYFSTHPDPVVKQVFLGLKNTQADDGMKNILGGSYSMIGFKNYLTIVVYSRYADSRGYTPFHISEKAFSITATFGWAFRKGAPFFRRFQQMIHRLEDAGILPYWSNDVIAQRIKEIRTAGDLNTDIVAGFSEEKSSEIPLGLNHLQGAFYLLFLGLIASTMTLLMEIFTHSQ